MTILKPNTWNKFSCVACGHLYDEALGDNLQGVPAGTGFDDVFDGWCCPVCGAAKSSFERHNDANIANGITHARQHGVVIIGGGLAGWSVVDAIRTLDKDIAITLIASDSADRYHKPMLSVAISQNKSPTDLVRIAAQQSADDQKIQLLANTEVFGIDALAKTVNTSKGNISYDNLVLAIGATVAYPPSINQNFAHHINDLGNFAKLYHALTTDSTPKDIAIIGAGMIGTELAEDLVNAGHRISLIDVNTRPLSALLPSIAGERILSAITDKGVNWLGSSKVERLCPTAQGYQITLVGQHQITAHFDEIIVATGLLVDDRLPKSAGIDFDARTGIKVCPHTLQTSVPSIYALGDCISIDGVPCRYVAPHRPQALAIAHEILGLKHAGYQHKAPMIRLKNKSVSVTANGAPVADGDWRVVKDNDGELSLEMIKNGDVIAKALLKSPIAS